MDRRMMENRPNTQIKRVNSDRGSTTDVTRKPRILEIKRPIPTKPWGGVLLLYYTFVTPFSAKSPENVPLGIERVARKRTTPEQHLNTSRVFSSIQKISYLEKTWDEAISSKASKGGNHTREIRRSPQGWKAGLTNRNRKGWGRRGKRKEEKSQWYNNKIYIYIYMYIYIGKGLPVHTISFFWCPV